MRILKVLFSRIGYFWLTPNFRTYFERKHAAAGGENKQLTVRDDYAAA